MDAFVQPSQVDFDAVPHAATRGHTVGGSGANLSNSEDSDAAHADSNELPPMPRTAEEEKKHRLKNYDTTTASRMTSKFIPATVYR